MDQRIKDLVSFQIIDRGDNSIRAQLFIDPKLPSFEGHFPDKPILPAVSIIDISMHLLETLKGPLAFDQLHLKRSKFTGMIAPGTDVEINATAKNDNDSQIDWVSLEDSAKLAHVQMGL